MSILLFISLTLLILLEVFYKIIFVKENDENKNLRTIATLVFSFFLGLLIGDYTTPLVYILMKFGVYDNLLGYFNNGDRRNLSEGVINEILKKHTQVTIDILRLIAITLAITILAK